MYRASRKNRERDSVLHWETVALLSPAAVLIAGLLLVPIGYAVYLGLTNLELLGPFARHYQFTGTANIKQLVNDPTFGSSLVETLIFVVGGATGATLCGFVLALLMQEASAILRSVVGGIAIVAWVLPPVAAGLVWYALTTPRGTLSMMVGSPKLDLLYSAPLAVVTIGNIWQLLGFGMVLLSAALRGVPSEIIDAARVDDIPGWRRVMGIILPVIWPSVVTVFLLAGLLSLGNFTLIYVLTRGGPGTSTSLLSVFSYLEAFTFNRLGFGTLISVVMVLGAGVLGYGFVKAVSRSSAVE